MSTNEEGRGHGTRRYWRKAIGAGLVCGSLLAGFGLTPVPVAVLAGAVLAGATGLALSRQAADPVVAVAVPAAAAVPPDEVIDAVFDPPDAGSGGASHLPQRHEGQDTAGKGAGQADPQPSAAGRVKG